MCIRKVISNEGANDEVQHDVEPEVLHQQESSREMQPHTQHEVQYNNVQNVVANSEMIPDRMKIKIRKAIDKYMKRYITNIISNDNDKINMKNSKRNSKFQMEINIATQATNKFNIFKNITLEYWKEFQQSNLYKILFQTTQPAHVIAIVAVLCIVSAVIPRSDVKINNGNQPHSKLLSFIYLTSFILHMGSQFWMTFVSGLSLYFALPKRNFSQVQRVLFPRYFTINACFSITTLVIFLKYHPFNTWNTEITIQTAALFTAFFLELIIRLYLTPPLIGLLTAKAAIEQAAGIGTEVGSHSLGPLENCPHYVKMNRAFRKIHSFIAAGNILTMVCTVIHLNYIASKICF